MASSLSSFAFGSSWRKSSRNYQGQDRSRERCINGRGCGSGDLTADGGATLPLQLCRCSSYASCKAMLDIRTGCLDGLEFTEERRWCRVTAKASFPHSSQWLEEGCSWPGEKRWEGFPTCLRAVPKDFHQDCRDRWSCCHFT